MTRYSRAGRFPTLREALAPEYASLPDEGIAELVESLYPGSDARDVENVFRTLKRVGKSVGKVAQRALPGVIQGATTGMALGPWGALAGGLAGGALSAASGGGGGGGRGGRGGKGGRRRGRGGLGRLGGFAKQAAGIAGQVAGMAGSPAANQLFRTINRPEVGQALQALAMGGAGRQSVNVGGTSIPVSAITTALRSLLQQAEMEHHERTAGESTGTPRYLLRDDGEFAVDPTDENARAELVLELLESVEFSGEDDEAEAVRVEYAEPYAEWEEDDPESSARQLYPGVYASTADRD